MRKMMAILASTLIILLGACATQPQRLNSVEAHKAVIEKGQRPMMVLSPELTREWVDEIKDGWRVIGIGVDDYGNFLIWAEHAESGKCIAAVVSPRTGSKQLLPSCEAADEIHKSVCVDQGKCNNNPYIDGDV